MELKSVVSRVIRMGLLEMVVNRLPRTWLVETSAGLSSG